MASKKIIRTSENTDLFTGESQVTEPQADILDEVDEILTETTLPYMQVQTVSMDDEKYPWAMLKSRLKLLPQNLYYVGNFDLLTARQNGREVVGITMSARPGTRTLDGMKSAELERVLQEYNQARKDSCKIADGYARKGAVILVESFRPHDVEIINAALAAGGNVIVSTPLNVNHRSNASIQQLQSPILNGRVLVVSATETENFNKWNSEEGNYNHSLMVAIQSRLYATRVGVRVQGPWIYTRLSVEAGVPTYVLRTNSDIHHDLIHKDHCQPFSFKPVD